MYIHKTPPTPPQNTPFPGLNLRVGKMNYRLGKMDPNWAKSGQSLSRSGQKNFIHHDVTMLDAREGEVRPQIAPFGNWNV